MSGNKVKITINGKLVETTAGAPLLQASIDAGIEVPHFCYHPGIGIEGSCRLCLVEVQGAPKLQTSCTVPVKEGMVVSTDSSQVKKARKGVLEFFLLNHPLDCPFCDKGGECPLQNFTYDSGQFASRFAFQKQHKPKHQVIGDHIILDKERCVLCNRCVRFLRNSTGREELQIGMRGAKSEIFIPDGTQLTSGFTGNLADICPVGALTTREFRFRARPWEMKTTNSVCGECSLGCSVQVWRKNMDVLRLTPRVEPAVNEWWLCDRGRFSIQPLLGGDRFKLPEKAGDSGAWTNSKATAASLANDIRRVPDGALACVADATMTNEEFWQLKSLAEAAGHARLFVPASNALVELTKKLDEASLTGSFPEDLEASDTVLVLGGRLDDVSPVLALRLRKLHAQRRAQIVTVVEGESGFEDIEAAHMEPRRGEWSGVIQALTRFEKGETRTSEESAGEIIAKAKSLYVLLCDRLVSDETLPAIHKWLEAIQGSSRRVRFSILFSGANLRGMVDRWRVSGGIESIDSLETEIQRGKVQGLLWFGKAPATPVFDEYAKGMRLFAQWILRKSNAHPKAQWLFPLDTFFEKAGTYTNTFGRVQAVRRTARLVEKGFEPLSMLVSLSAELGKPGHAESSQIYGDLARDLAGYPKSREEIPESVRTYTHYERALWR